MIAGRLLRKYPNTSKFDIDDVVAAAMLDLIEYWQHLPSSIDPDNPDRNFAYAIRRGTWMATEFLVQRFRDKELEVSLTDSREGDTHSTSLIERIASDEDTPERVVSEADELQQIRNALADLPAGELRGWMDDYLAGVSERQQAAAEGVRRDIVMRRRRSGIKRLRAAMRQAGLDAAP